MNGSIEHPHLFLVFMFSHDVVDAVDGDVVTAHPADNSAQRLHQVSNSSLKYPEEDEDVSSTRSSVYSSRNSVFLSTVSEQGDETTEGDESIDELPWTTSRQRRRQTCFATAPPRVHVPLRLALSSPGSVNRPLPTPCEHSDDELGASAAFAPATQREAKQASEHALESTDPV